MCKWRRERDWCRTFSTTNPLILFTVKISPTLQADDCVSHTARCNLDIDPIPPAQKPVVGGVEFAIFDHSLRPVSRIMMRTFRTSVRCLSSAAMWSKPVVLLAAPQPVCLNGHLGRPIAITSTDAMA